MKTTQKYLSTCFFILVLIALSGCDNSDSETDNDTETENTSTGSLQIEGSYDGQITAEATLEAAVFPCPFTMPPSYLAHGLIDTNGNVFAELDDIETGDWCVMVYIDMVPGDSLAPVAGLDAVNVGGNESNAIEVTITENETATLDLTFAVQ